MKNSIALLGIISFLCSAGYSQKTDTLWFSKEKCYSRCLAKKNNELYLGTSSIGVVAINLLTNQTETILENKHNEEVRDLWLHKNTLYAMFSGDHGFVYAIDLSTRTSTLILSDSNTFLDDLCGDNNQLYILGDPKHGHFYLRTFAFKSGTFSDLLPPVNAFENEACYAASGTTALIDRYGNYCFVSGGGNHARFHQFKKVNGKIVVTSVELPMSNGEGCGPFSLVASKYGLITVGGCWNTPNNADGSAAISDHEGNKWLNFDTNLGYKSCVVSSKKFTFSCGTKGIEKLAKEYRYWEPFSDGNFCALLLNKNTLYATSNKGYLIRFNLD